VSKKNKFKAGLDALFEQTTEAHIQETTVIVPNVDGSAIVATKSGKRPTNKNFILDLESLLHDALQGAVEQNNDKLRKTYGIGHEHQERETTSQPMRLMGLDALIRRTDDTTSVSVDYSSTRRVTFVFENRKLEKLKSIASNERTYIKDIVNTAVSHFIEEYERKKGKI
jgi:hypothetical protein